VGLVVEHIDKFDDGKFKLFCFMLIFTFDLNAQRTTSIKLQDVINMYIKSMRSWYCHESKCAT
jgi:hypothetical protein